MGWTLDGKSMYFTDSPTGNIFKYNFDPATGDISDKTVFFHVDGEKEDGAVPDGFAQDVEGNLWVALCGGWKVVKVSPEGMVIGVIKCPTRSMTCPGFVGTQLYITSAEEEEAEKYPRSVKFGGSLFRVDVGVEGTPMHRFKRNW